MNLTIATIINFMYFKNEKWHLYICMAHSLEHYDRSFIQKTLMAHPRNFKLHSIQIVRKVLEFPLKRKRVHFMCDG